MYSRNSKYRESNSFEGKINNALGMINDTIYSNKHIFIYNSKALV